MDKEIAFRLSAPEPPPTGERRRIAIPRWVPVRRLSDWENAVEAAVELGPQGIPDAHFAERLTARERAGKTPPPERRLQADVQPQHILPDGEPIEFRSWIRSWSSWSMPGRTDEGRFLIAVGRSTLRPLVTRPTVAICAGAARRPAE